MEGPEKPVQLVQRREVSEVLVVPERHGRRLKYRERRDVPPQQHQVYQLDLDVVELEAHQSVLDEVMEPY